MPRNCFVIMPFSKTSTCSEEEWSWIFENVIKDAVESAGLDYVCKRSVATRGNIVGAIMQDLNDSHVVIADLTDRNANVFYELGVRHATKDRSILIAQKQEDIPFDLQGYAFHVYGWKTPEYIKALSDKIRQILTEMDSNPNRPDNPVSDFLRVRHPAETELATATVTPIDVQIAQPLAGQASEGADIPKLVRTLVGRNRPQDAKTIYRLTKAELIPLIGESLRSLNAKGKSGSVTRDQIYTQATEFITAVEPTINTIEYFGLTSVQEGWEPGLGILMKLSGNLISITEISQPGLVTRYAQGAPALLAWRMLCLCGAKALDEDEFGLLKYLTVNPIEVEEATGKFSYRPLIDRHDLFFPEAFLGYADIPMEYFKDLWNRTNHLQECFDSNESYQMAIAKFFIFAALAAKSSEGHSPIFPGYHLLPQAGRAMSAITSRMFSSNTYLEAIAEAMSDNGSHLKAQWAERVKSINDVPQGRWSPFASGALFPSQFGKITD
jgi:hypothetical protein